MCMCSCVGGQETKHLACPFFVYTDSKGSGKIVLITKRSLHMYAISTDFLPFVNLCSIEILIFSNLYSFRESHG